MLRQAIPREPDPSEMMGPKEYIDSLRFPGIFRNSHDTTRSTGGLNLAL